MKTRAAVAWKAGAPLTIETVDLDGPRVGEVLVEVKATGICHTDHYTLSGADPEGLFPAILGHEGAGVVVDVGPGVAGLKNGDHVIPLYTPGMPPVRVLPVVARRISARLIRGDAGASGLMPDGSQPLLASNGEPLFHYMGTSDLQPISHRRSRNSAGKDPRGRAFRQGLLHRLRRHDRTRRRALFGESGGRRQRRRLRAWAASAST